MTKLLLLLFILPITSFAQSSSFKKLDSSAFMKRIDATIKITGQDYIFKAHEIDHHEDRDILLYVSRPNYIQIFYRKTNDEIGTDATSKKWNIEIFKSDLETIFPIWKALVDKKATKDELLKVKFQTIGNFTIYQMPMAQGRFWCIKIE